MEKRTMTDEEVYDQALRDTTMAEIAARLDEYDESNRVLWSEEAAQLYAGMWAAAYKGKIVASGVNMGDIMTQLREQSIPTCHTAVEFFPYEPPMDAF
jgi:hypothetical protein